jgi:hypothetical protein
VSDDTAVLIPAFAVLVVLGCWIASRWMASVITVLYREASCSTHRAPTVMGVDSFVLLAIPLFIFAGTIMEMGGFRAAGAFRADLFGRFRGGLPRRASWRGPCCNPAFRVDGRTSRPWLR